MKKNNLARSQRSQVRSEDRKSVVQVDVLSVKNLVNQQVYFSRATIVDVSPTGVLLRVKREHIVDKDLRANLTLAGIHTSAVGFTIEVMDTYIEGTVARSRTEGKGEFVLAIDFRDDAPEYWRQCLFDLLPDGSEVP